jgi:hypothetical protein
MTAPANNHDNTDAPPAALAAVNAPNNHPEPMTEPSDTNINATGPTSRRNPETGIATCPVEMSVTVMNLRMRRRQPATDKTASQPRIAQHCRPGDQLHGHPARETQRVRLVERDAETQESPRNSGANAGSCQTAE